MSLTIPNQQSNTWLGTTAHGFGTYDPFTIMAWAQCGFTSNNHWYTVGALDDASAAHWFGGYRSGGTRSFFVWDGSSNTGSTISADTWYHMALVGKSGASTDYDGYLDGTLDINCGVRFGGSKTNRMTIGGNVGGTNETIDGHIVALKVWDVELSADEIKAEGEQIFPRRFSNLVGFWPWVDQQTLTFNNLITGPNASGDLSETGTAADVGQVQPPVPWRVARKRYYLISAAVSFVEVPTGGSTCAATGTCTASLDILASVPPGGSTASSSGALTATLDVVRSISATAASSATVTAQLNRIASLASTAASSATVTATLEAVGAVKEIPATCAAVGALAAQLNRITSLSATAASTGSLTASLGRIRTLASTAASSATVTATLQAVSAAVKEISATCAAVGAATAQLNRIASLSATAASSGALAAQLNRIASLSATAASSATVTATLEKAGQKLLPATVSSSGALAAQLNRIASLASTAASSGALTAQLDKIAALAATAAASGALSATLTTKPLDLIAASASATGALSVTLEIQSDFVEDVRRNFESGSRLAFGSSAGRVFETGLPV